MSGRIEFLSILIWWTLSWSFLKISSTSAFWILWYCTFGDSLLSTWTLARLCSMDLHITHTLESLCRSCWDSWDANFLKRRKRPSVENLNALEGCFACHICAMVKGKHFTFWVSFVCHSVIPGDWVRIVTLVKGSWTNRRPWRPARGPKAPCEAGGIWMLEKRGIFGDKWWILLGALGKYMTIMTIQ